MTTLRPLAAVLGILAVVLNLTSGLTIHAAISSPSPVVYTALGVWLGFAGACVTTLFVPVGLAATEAVGYQVPAEPQGVEHDG